MRRDKTVRPWPSTADVWQGRVGDHSRYADFWYYLVFWCRE